MTDAFHAASPRLKRVVGALGFGPADADDILQRVFITLREHPPDWRGPEALDRWLYATTVNAARLEYRRRDRFQRAARCWSDNAAARTQERPSSALALDEDRRRVRQALIGLDVDLAVPLVLRYFRGWNATRIAETLNLPSSTVRARLRRARLCLAEKLRD